MISSQNNKQEYGTKGHEQVFSVQVWVEDIIIEMLNNTSHGLSPPGGFSSLFFDQAVPYYSRRHLHLHR